jgi:hypothetical protein
VPVHSLRYRQSPPGPAGLRDAHPVAARHREQAAAQRIPPGAPLGSCNITASAVSARQAPAPGPCAARCCHPASPFSLLGDAQHSRSSRLAAAGRPASSARGHNPHYFLPLPTLRPPPTGACTFHAQVGVGAVVLNERGEILVVQERSGPLRGKGVWKMPTGLVQVRGAHCALGVPHCWKVVHCWEVCVLWCQQGWGRKDPVPPSDAPHATHTCAPSRGRAPTSTPLLPLLLCPTL